MAEFCSTIRKDALVETLLYRTRGIKVLSVEMMAMTVHLRWTNHF